MTDDEKELMEVAAERLEELRRKWEPHTYDYGTETLIRDLRRAAGL